MMNYRHTHNRNEPRGRIAGRRYFLFFLLIFFVVVATPSFVKESAHTVAAPFWRVARTFRSASENLTAYLRTRGSLIEEVRTLRAEIERGEAELVDRRALFDENQELKLLLGKRPSSERRVIASVLASPPRSPYDTLVLDAGMADGVSKSDIVFIGNAAVGSIAETSKHVSVAALFSTSGTRMDAAIVRGGEHIPIKAVGEGGGTFSAVLPREISIMSGDPIIAPDLRSAVLAEISAVENGASDSFQTVYFKSPVSLTGVRFVEIGIVGEENPDAEYYEENRR